MTSCTIIISHFESVPFLRACIRQIIKHQHPDVMIDEVIIADQSRWYVFQEISAMYKDDISIKVLHIAPHYSGYGLDWIFRNVEIKSEYIVQIHADAFPISDKWLPLSVKLIEEYNLSFVGQLQFINVDSSIYPPNPFFAMAQCFNVAKTETYREMSMEAGFTRYHQRATLDMEFKNDDWAMWAKDDYKNRGSDDDVVAFHWEDTHREHNKLGLAITGYISPAYGRIIDDIVFHFGSCRESIGTGDAMGEEYKMFTQKINENYSDELIYEMVQLAKANRPPELEILSRNFWNGKTKQSSPPTDELNKRIEELKQ